MILKQVEILRHNGIFSFTYRSRKVISEKPAIGSGIKRFSIMSECERPYPRRRQTLIEILPIFPGIRALKNSPAAAACSVHNIDFGWMTDDIADTACKGTDCFPTGARIMADQYFPLSQFSSAERICNIQCSRTRGVNKDVIDVQKSKIDLLLRLALIRTPVKLIRFGIKNITAARMNRDRCGLTSAGLVG